MKALLGEIRHNPILWLLLFVPVVFAAEEIAPQAHTLLFGLSILAIVPLAALLSRATESVAAKTGDMIGGLLNATLGNLTELVIAITALRQGMHELVKASIVGAVVTNALFLLGGSFLLGGLKYHLQEFSRETARLQAPAAVGVRRSDHSIGSAPSIASSPRLHHLSVGLHPADHRLRPGLALLCESTRAVASAEPSAAEGEEPWPIGTAAALPQHGAAVLVSEVFVESVQQAARSWG
jgi:Ca2+:H+ antiporter